MAIFFDAPVAPDALTTFTREVPTPSTLRLLAEAGRRDEDDNTIDFGEIVRTNRTARYRSWDGRIHVSQRDTGSTKRVKLPPLSSSLSLGEYERLQLEFARTGGTNTARLADAIYDDATNLTREVQHRLELAIGDVLTDGVLSINENGFISTADFGVPGTHKVTAGTAWTTTTASILDDLVAWADVYTASNGAMPGAIRTSLRVQRLMQRNEQLIGAIHGTTSGKTRVTLDELNDLLASEGLPALSPAYDGRVDVDGVDTRVIPDDRLLFTPAALDDLVEVAWGVTATALELVNSNQSDLAFEEAAGIVGVVVKEGPPFRQWTYVDACAMPVLSDARRLFIADVA